MSAAPVALVTGGLERLGGRIAARLAEDGWALALHCRESCRPSPALAQAIARTGVASAILPADLADAGAAPALVARAADRFGVAPALLVNSASVISEGGWDAVSLDALMEHHRVNVAAPVMLAQALAAALAPGGTANVVNILDQRVRNPPVDQAAYTASKLALASLTRTLARAFAPRLRVNAVAPGLTLPGDDYRPGQVERLAAAMPLRHLPRPEDVGDAVVFLAGATAITGQTLYVDGGAAIESWPRDFVHMAAEA